MPVQYERTAWAAGNAQNINIRSNKNYPQIYRLLNRGFLYIYKIALMMKTVRCF